jgi:hypothetical protein
LAAAMMVSDPVRIRMLVPAACARSHHDDGRVHHSADGNGDPTERHDAGRDMQVGHRDEGEQHCHGQDENRHQGAAQVKQKDYCDQADDDALLHELLAEHGNGPMNEIRPVVGGNDVDASSAGPA